MADADWRSGQRVMSDSCRIRNRTPLKISWCLEILVGIKLRTPQFDWLAWSNAWGMYKGKSFSLPPYPFLFFGRNKDSWICSSLASRLASRWNRGHPLKRHRFQRIAKALSSSGAIVHPHRSKFASRVDYQLARKKESWWITTQSARSYWIRT